MKFIEDETVVKSKKEGMLLPTFKFNFREIEILYSILSKAVIYIPEFLMPDKSRIRQMQKEFLKYLKSKELAARRLKIEVEGLDKLLIITAHALQRMKERSISLDFVKESIVKADIITEQNSTKIFEYKDTRFIVDDKEEEIVLITLYRNEEIG